MNRTQGKRGERAGRARGRRNDRPRPPALRPLAALAGAALLTLLAGLAACTETAAVDTAEPAAVAPPEAPTAPAPEEPAPPPAAVAPAPAPAPTPSIEAGPTAAAPPAEGVAAIERRNQELAAALGLPVYPAARPVPSLSSEAPSALRIVLTTDDPCDRVVRFYEQATGQVAQVTELSDGDIYDIVLKTAPDGDPIQGVQVRQTPRAIADRLTGRTSIILFRRTN